MNSQLRSFALALLAGLGVACADTPTQAGLEASVADTRSRPISAGATLLSPKFHAVLRRNFNQSIPDNVKTAIAWDVEEADFGNLHITGASDVTLGPGTWLLVAIVNFSSDVDGYRSVSIGPNLFARTVSSIQGVSATTLTATLVASVPVGTTANYSVYVQHAAGNSLDVMGSDYSRFFVVQLGPDPFVRLHKSALQTLLNQTVTALTWDVEGADAWNLHGAGAPSVTLPSGIWLLSPFVSWATNASGVRITSIAENGTDIGLNSSSIQGGGVGQSMNLPLVRVVPSGQTRDYEVRGLQSSGGNLNVVGESCSRGICKNPESNFYVAQLNPDPSSPSGILRAVTQSIPHSSWTPVTWVSEHCPNPSICGPNGFENVGPGVWLLIAVVTWESNSNGVLAAVLQETEGGSQVGPVGVSYSSIQAANTAHSMILPLVKVVPAGATREYRVDVWQGTGGSLDVFGGVATYFIAVQLATL